LLFRFFDIWKPRPPGCEAPPIAAAAIPALEKEGDIKAYLDGTVSALLASMDRSGIERSVLCSIAIRSERIIPFPSLHPADPRLLEHLQIIHDPGFKGVKMPPYSEKRRIENLVFSNSCGNFTALRLHSPDYHPTGRSSPI